MASTILSRRDLDFLLYEWLAAESLIQRQRFSEHSRETFDAVLDLCEQLATDKFANHNKKSDQNEPHFDGERVHKAASFPVSTFPMAPPSPQTNVATGRTSRASSQPRATTVWVSPG